MRTKVGKTHQDAGRRKWRRILRRGRRRGKEGMFGGVKEEGRGRGDGFCDKAN